MRAIRGKDGVEQAGLVGDGCCVMKQAGAKNSGMYQSIQNRSLEAMTRLAD